MHAGIEPRIDMERGCRWRKAGGLYLVSGQGMAPCGRLPIPLDVCPTCGHGIHPSRGWTWVEADAILAGHRTDCESPLCRCCPLSPHRRGTIGRVGLLWVGEQYYGSPREFSAEAIRIGISRRIAAIPAGFVCGETWVWLAHRRSISRRCKWCRADDVVAEEAAMKAGDWRPAARSLQCSHCRGQGVTWHPGVFQAFRPESIEYVVRGDETDAEIDSLIKRGITPVKITRQEETQSDLFTTTETHQ